MTRRRTAGRAAALLGSVAALAASGGCAWQGYVTSRGVRLITGVSTRVHTIVPLTQPLRPYRTIEARWLKNLLPGRVPPDLEQDLNDQLADALHHVASAPDVVRVDPDLPADLPVPPPASGTPTLEFAGFIDDYDPGYFGLRLAELGFNHMVMTIRVELRDTATQQVLAAASITAQDDRATATGRATIARLVDRVRAFVGAGYAR
jgi:hypothetical protein